jgi:lysophospholipid acyltransferase (LPLAT)-like uncharacterized protein
MNKVVSSQPEAGSARKTRRQTSGVIVPHAPRWYQRAAAWVIYAALKSVMATLRYTWIDRSDFCHPYPDGPAIYTIWHNRLTISMKVYERFNPGNLTPGLAVMVSASKDGGLLTAVLENFKVRPVRGSSSRRGRQALLELTTWAQDGYDVALTPDGPRGPCYVVQDGVISLAQLTGLPIVPVSCHLAWKLRIKSWDRFQIPLPFSRCEVIIEKPIRVPRDAPEEQRETARQQLEHTLRAISKD